MFDTDRNSYYRSHTSSTELSCVIQNKTHIVSHIFLVQSGSMCGTDLNTYRKSQFLVQSSVIGGTERNAYSNLYV